MKKKKVVEQKISRTSYIRRLVIEQKKCPQCGKTFEGIKKQKYCSRPCQKQADYERHAEEYRQARVEKYHAEKKRS